MRDKPRYIKDITEEEWYAKLDEEGLNYEDERFIYSSTLYKRCPGWNIENGAFIECNEILNSDNEIDNKGYIEITKKEYEEGTYKMLIAELNRRKKQVLNEFAEKIKEINELINITKKRFEN